MSFFTSLWESVFTPGPTPTLLLATNASFGALQLLLLALLLATYSVHFVVLSILCAGLWYSINWFAREVQIAKAQEEAEKAKASVGAGKKSDDLASGAGEDGGDEDTETEGQEEDEAISAQSSPAPPPYTPPPPPRGSSLKPVPAEGGSLRKRQTSMGDSSGYVSTDSEWDKVSEAGDKSQD